MQHVSREFIPAALGVSTPYLTFRAPVAAPCTEYGARLVRDQRQRCCSTRSGSMADGGCLDAVSGPRRRGGPYLPEEQSTVSFVLVPGSLERDSSCNRCHLKVTSAGGLIALSDNACTWDGTPPIRGPGTRGPQSRARPGATFVPFAMQPGHAHPPEMIRERRQNSPWRLPRSMQCACLLPGSSTRRRGREGGVLRRASQA